MLFPLGYFLSNCSFVINYVIFVTMFLRCKKPFSVLNYSVRLLYENENEAK